MRRTLYAVTYLVLLSVVVSCLNSVWIGLTDLDRYQSVFPNAQGAILWATMLLSFLAATNAILIGFQNKWAILANPLIGLISIILIELVDGPRRNEIVIFVACTLSTAIPWYLWVRPLFSSRVE